MNKGREPKPGEKCRECNRIYASHEWVYPVKIGSSLKWVCIECWRDWQ